MLPFWTVWFSFQIVCKCLLWRFWQNFRFLTSKEFTWNFKFPTCSLWRLGYNYFNRTICQPEEILIVLHWCCFQTLFRWAATGLLLVGSGLLSFIGFLQIPGCQMQMVMLINLSSFHLRSLCTFVLQLWHRIAGILLCIFLIWIDNIVPIELADSQPSSVVKLF